MGMRVPPSVMGKAGQQRGPLSRHTQVQQQAPISHTYQQLSSLAKWNIIEGRRDKDILPISFFP